MQATRQMFFWVVVVTALPGAPLRGAVGVSDFPHIVQRADAVVRARMIRWDEIVGPEGESPSFLPGTPGARPVERVMLLEVRKVLAGQCPDRLFVTQFYDHRDSLHLKLGQEAYLCLGRSPRVPGAWEAMNLGLLALPVREDGRAAVPKHVHYLEGAARLLEPETVETAENVEAALRYYRGPDMEIRPLKDVFALDDPLALEVTLTNRTPRRMVIALDRGRALRQCFSLGLWDAQGRSVLESQRLVTREDMLEESALDYLRDAVPLRPGDSVRRVVRFVLPPAQFVFSPDQARTATLNYGSRAAEGMWFGWQFAQCPVRLRCADPAWTDTLAQPTDGLAVTLRVYGVWGPVRSTVGTPRDLWVRAMLSRPEPGPILRSRMTGGFSYSGPGLLPAERAALNAHLEVRLGDRILARPAPASGGLATLLERLRPGQTARHEHWNLAEAFDFPRPGLYRVRLVVPDGDAAARSNELLVRIPEAEGDTRKETP